MGVREEPDDGLAHDLQVVLLVSGDRGPDELQAVFSQRCMLQEEPAAQLASRHEVDAVLREFGEALVPAAHPLVDALAGSPLVLFLLEEGVHVRTLPEDVRGGQGAELLEQPVNALPRVLIGAGQLGVRHRQADAAGRPRELAHQPGSHGVLDLQVGGQAPQTYLVPVRLPSGWIAVPSRRCRILVLPISHDAVEGGCP